MPINLENYHPKWTLIVRMIRRRSGNRCEGSPAYPDCRAIHGRLHPVTGSIVILTTAHLDQDIKNNRFSNLRHWCQRCHLKHDTGQRATTRKYGNNNEQLNLFQ